MRDQQVAGTAAIQALPSRENPLAHTKLHDGDAGLYGLTLNSNTLDGVHAKPFHVCVIVADEDPVGIGVVETALVGSHTHDTV